MSEQTIFLSALEYSGPERTAYLDQACAGNEPLRRQVDGLLAAHDRSGEFLNQPAVDQIAAQPTPGDQATRTFSADSAVWRIVASSASDGTLILSRTLPLTCTGSSIVDSLSLAGSYTGHGRRASDLVGPINENTHDEPP